MNATIPQTTGKDKQRTENSRLREQSLHEQFDRPTPFLATEPVLQNQNIVYQVAEKSQATIQGGLPAIHKLAHQIGLIQAIDEKLHVLKIHNPYHESDHVLNFALNTLAGGTCLQDIEKLRTDLPLLRSISVAGIPAPSTAGDFTRRFLEKDIWDLQDAIDIARKKVWNKQPDEFFHQAILDVDGTICSTLGDCKEQADFSHKGCFGYHPLLITLANTNEVLAILNRSGNRPSHELAHQAIDRCVKLCFEGGFGSVLLRGDTDFSQTQHLDRWHEQGHIEFVFGYDAYPNLKARAENLPSPCWQELIRESEPEPKTKPRERPENIRARRVLERGYRQLVTVREEVAEFDYQPTACERCYRMVVLKKHIDVLRRGERIEQQIRYYFYITNDRQRTAQQIVFCANGRCNQENVIAQLKSGSEALRARVSSLHSHWAQIVMMTLGWNLKSWWALLLPLEPGGNQQQQEQEKRFVLVCELPTFIDWFVRMPAQIVSSGGRLVVRLLNWNRYQGVFLRLVSVLNC